MTGNPAGEQIPVKNRQAVISHVNHKLHGLKAGISQGTSASSANLARLRRAVNEPPGSMPDIWSITLGNLPAQLVGRTDAPSYGETAVHSALALFAIHQQGKGDFMHRSGSGLGSAVRNYIHANDPAEGFNENSPILRRFNALTTSDSVDELLWHLRSLITQLRGSAIELDFAELAGNIYDFQFVEARDRIRLRWGRQLYTAPPKTTNVSHPDS